MEDSLNRSKSEGEAITPAGMKALETDIEELETEGRRNMAARILAARELGDLKENAEYHIAKHDQAHLETKIKNLRERRRNAVVVETEADNTVLAFGGTAVILDKGSDKLHTWTIVGPTEADVGNGKLSAESPVGAALLGHASGDEVEVRSPRGSSTYRVEKLII
jgi:transcription elongation factor GreA